MIIFIALIPQIWGILRGVQFIVRFIPGLMTALRWVGGFVTKFWPSVAFFGVFCIRSVGFLLSFKGFLVLVSIWVVSQLLGWGDEFTGFIVEMVSYVLGFLFDFLFEEESGLIWSIAGFLIEKGTWFLGHSDFVNTWTEPFSRYSGAINSSKEIVGRLNQFFPIVEAGILIGFFSVFIIFFLGIKFILKLIPGMG